jgi:MFS family permease
MIQGLCLGGQYGGAITYVAEHVEDKHRGYYTDWLQASPTLGIVLLLLVIIATRTYFGTDAFNAWAWRIPFLFSFLLVFICRLRSLSSLRADPDYRNSTHPLRICGRNFGGRFSHPSWRVIGPILSIKELGPNGAVRQRPRRGASFRSDNRARSGMTCRLPISEATGQRLDADCRWHWLSAQFRRG